MIEAASDQSPVRGFVTLAQQRQERRRVEFGLVHALAFPGRFGAFFLPRSTAVTRRRESSRMFVEPSATGEAICRPAAT